MQGAEVVKFVSFYTVGERGCSGKKSAAAVSCAEADVSLFADVVVEADLELADKTPSKVLVGGFAGQREGIESPGGTKTEAQDGIYAFGKRQGSTLIQRE